MQIIFNGALARAFGARARAPTVRRQKRVLRKRRGRRKGRGSARRAARRRSRGGRLGVVRVWRVSNRRSRTRKQARFTRARQAIVTAHFQTKAKSCCMHHIRNGVYILSTFRDSSLYPTAICT